jgi:hypothetical protein
VNDSYESLVDAKTLRPLKFTKRLSEGHYKCHEITTFDFQKMTAHYEHLLNGEKKSYPIDNETRDILSFMYFMRAELLDENQETEYRVMADEKLYDLILKTEEIDKVSLPAYKDKVSCLKMIPEAKFDGLFVRKGKATLWVSRDPRRLLALAKIKVPFGKARVKLKRVSGPGSDFWITQQKDGVEDVD